MAGCGRARRAGAGAVPIKNGTVKVKVLPFPGALSSTISPFINWIRRAEIESPSPVPPNSRVVDESACEKASKICRDLTLQGPGDFQSFLLGTDGERLQGAFHAIQQ